MKKGNTHSEGRYLLSTISINDTKLRSGNPFILRLSRYSNPTSKMFMSSTRSVSSPFSAEDNNELIMKGVNIVYTLSYCWHLP